jgi:hypothetical protein
VVAETWREDGLLERIHEKYAVFSSRAVIGGHRRDDVADPPQESTAANPQAGGDEQPEDPAQEIAVIELSETRKECAQHRRRARILCVCHFRTFVGPTANSMKSKT